MMGSADAEP